MLYNPEYLTTDFQKIYHFEILKEFIWTNCKIPYSKINSLNSFENDTYYITLYPKDILNIRYFKPNKDGQLYVYLESITSPNNQISLYNTETIISKGLMDVNSHIFQDITKQIERNNKINICLH